MGTETVIPGELDIACLAAATVAGEIRQRMALRLAAWGLPELAGDAVLIADELITNACAATPDSEIRIRFTREPTGVLLGVWDSSNDMPLAKPVKELTLESLDLSEENFDNNGGWGMAVVLGLSSECGVQRTEPCGKWVWARCTSGGRP